MTDRLAGFIVTLAEDTRVDDAEATLSAIKQIKGVLSVQPVVADVELAMAEERVRMDLRRDIYEVLG